MPMPKLEVFDTGTAQTKAEAIVVTQVGAMEEARLAAYELGYQAGWDDATAAQAENQSQIRADLAHNLNQLSFSYEEARAHLLTALKPLFEEMVSQLLPQIARDSFASLVLEQMMSMAEKVIDQPVHLVLNPVVRPAVESLITAATGLPLAIVEEPTLPEGQVYIRLGQTEAQVDLGRVTAEISTAVRGFFTLAEERESDG